MLGWVKILGKTWSIDVNAVGLVDLLCVGAVLLGFMG